jgi:hypothetical protein
MFGIELLTLFITGICVLLLYTELYYTNTYSFNENSITQMPISRYRDIKISKIL